MVGLVPPIFPVLSVTDPTSPVNDDIVTVNNMWRPIHAAEKTTNRPPEFVGIWCLRN